MVISIALASLSEARVLQKSVGFRFPLLLSKISFKDGNKNIVHIGKQYNISERYKFQL